MNIVSTGMLLLLMAGTAHAQVNRQPANAIAPGTQDQHSKTVIVKTLPASVVDKALRRAGKGKLYLEVYPVKASAGSNPNDFDALVVFRDAQHVSYPERTVSEKRFEALAGNYARFMRSRQVQRSDVPFGYCMPVTWRKAGAVKYQIGINLQRFSISVSAGVGYVHECDSCKCPPECTLTFAQPASGSKSLLYSARMEQVVHAAYLKQQQ